MMDERLNALTLLNMENSILQSIDLDSIIKAFIDPNVEKKILFDEYQSRNILEITVF